MAAGPVSVGLKAEALSLYRQVHRIVKRLGEGATLYIRDFTHDGAPDIHYSLRDAGKRALNVWLRRNCDPGLQELLSKHGITLHSPVGTHDYQFDRAALRESVRLNFKVSERWIAEVEPKGRHLVQMALMSRALSLGTFLDHQMALHDRSSVCMSSATVLVPAETPRQVTLSYLSLYELKWRLGHVPFTGRPPKRMALQGDPLHARRLEELAAMPVAADDEARLAEYPEATCRNLADEWTDERAARRWHDAAGLQPAELAAQLRENYLNDAYWRRERAVVSADVFEQLALGSPPSTPAATDGAPRADAAAGDSVRSACGVGALPLPNLSPKRAAVRLHAISGVQDPKHFGKRSGAAPTHFEYQIIVENTGPVPLQVMGRFFRIGEWEMVGTRAHPAPRVLGRCPVILPGRAMAYKSAGAISEEGGTMRGGYLVKALPWDVARRLEAGYQYEQGGDSSPLDASALHPDSHFTVRISPFAVRPRPDAPPFSHRVAAAAGQGYSDGGSGGGGEGGGERDVHSKDAVKSGSSDSSASANDVPGRFEPGGREAVHAMLKEKALAFARRAPSETAHLLVARMRGEGAEQLARICELCEKLLGGAGVHVATWLRGVQQRCRELQGALAATAQHSAPDRRAAWEAPLAQHRLRNLHLYAIVGVLEQWGQDSWDGDKVRLIQPILEEELQAACGVDGSVAGGAAESSASESDDDDDDASGTGHVHLTLAPRRGRGLRVVSLRGPGGVPAGVLRAINRSLRGVQGSPDAIAAALEEAVADLENVEVVRVESGMESGDTSGESSGEGGDSDDDGEGGLRTVEQFERWAAAASGKS